MDTRFGGRKPKEPVFDVANWGEVIILAIPDNALTEIAKKQVRPLRENRLIDVEREQKCTSVIVA